MKTSREALLLIAFRLFLQKGHEQTSMQDLVATSGLSKGAFHHYFPRKSDLLNACIEHFFSRFLPEVSPLTDQHFDQLVLACAHQYGALLQELALLDISFAAYQRFVWSILPAHGVTFAERQRDLKQQLVRLAEQDLASQRLVSHTSAEILATQAMALIEGLGVMAALDTYAAPSDAATQLVASCRYWLRDLTR